MTGKHIIFGLAMFLVLSVGGVTTYLLQREAEAPTLWPPVVNVPPSAPAPVTLTGLPLCLPLKNPDSPQNDTCALGFRTDTGEYYALDFERMPKPPPDVSRGEILTLAGEIAPLENGTNSRFEQYEAVGLFMAASVISAPALSGDIAP